MRQRKNQTGGEKLEKFGGDVAFTLMLQCIAHDGLRLLAAPECDEDVGHLGPSPAQLSDSTCT